VAEGKFDLAPALRATSRPPGQKSSMLMWEPAGLDEVKAMREALSVLSLANGNCRWAIDVGRLDGYRANPAHIVRAGFD